LGSSFAKFAHVPGIVAQMAELGFDGPRLMIIAVLELASAALLLLPKTRPFGLLLVSAYLGGAIAAHLGHGQPPEPPAVLDRHAAEKRIHNYVAHPLGLDRRSFNSSRLRRRNEPDHRPARFVYVYEAVIYHASLLFRR
jgi:hypothetical protein